MRAIFFSMLLLAGLACAGEEAGKVAGANESPALNWRTDWDGALKDAAEKGKTVFAFFTGSDWCPWCVKLDGEVLSTPEFKKYAADNLILVLLDFPSQKKLEKELSEKNNELAVKYGVKGFPTVILLDGKGTVLGRSGYRPGGGAKYVEHLQTLAGTKKE